MTANGDVTRLVVGVPSFFVLLGSIFFVVGTVMVRRSRRFDRASVQVPGLCTELRPSWSGPSSEGTAVWHPVLAFRTLDGREMAVASPWGSAPAAARPGQPVTVRYDPADPRRARVDNLRARGTLVYGLMIALGGTFAFVGLLVLAIVVYVLNR